ncbi:hypothetical protein GCM10010253_30450 [Streptomyces badius]|uniref:Transposase n=1 Tax=Streptomyces badius TaxID=1941 RepID=A0ABQ2T626_STRBA|nr:hypothetical protein GCM10010253_30450 [Streptomyces badius]
MVGGGAGARAGAEPVIDDRMRGEERAGPCPLTDKEAGALRLAALPGDRRRTLPQCGDRPQPALFRGRRLHARMLVAAVRIATHQGRL